MTRAALVLALLFAGSTVTATAHAGWKTKHLDAVVASVDDRPITLFELRQRAKPQLMRLHAATPKEKWAESEVTLMRELLEQVIKQRLVTADLDSIRVGAPNDEVDHALDLIAGNAKLTRAQLIVEAGKAGMEEKDYREEIRRQILEAKWLMKRVRPNVKAGETEEKVAAAMLVELEKKYGVERDLL